MFWRRAARWRARQWLKRQRIRLAWVAGLLCVITVLTVTGGFEPLDHLFLEAMYSVRGERTSARRVAVVTGEGAAPTDLPQIVERILAQSPKLAVVTVPPSVDAGSLPCSDRILYVGHLRPAALPTDCSWQNAHDVSRDWQNVRLHAGSGERTPVARVVEETTGTTLVPETVAINLSGNVPRVAVVALAESSGLFGGNVVILEMEEEEVVPTPFGWMTLAAFRAEAIGALLEGETIRTPRWGAALLVLICLILGAAAAGKRRPLYWLGGGVVGVALVHYAGFVWWGLDLGGPATYTAFVGGLLVFGNVAADRKDAGRDVRVRLAAAIQEGMRRGAHRIATDRRFWPMLMDRVATEIDAPSMAIAERPLESWWIEFRTFQGMSEDDIAEQRRDVRRVPYREGFRTQTSTTVAGYLTDSEHDSILVPLVGNGEMCGFWVINHPSPDAFLDQNRQVVERVAAQLGSEVRTFQLEQRAGEIDERFSGRDADIVDASLSAMENLERERRVMEDVLANSRVGLMTTNLFGEISYENDVMRELLAESDVEFDTGDVASFLSQLTGLEVEEMARRLKTVIEERQTISLTTSVGDPEDERVLDLKVGPTVRRRAGFDIVQGLIVTAADITAAVESDRSRLDVVKTLNSRVTDLVDILSGYANVLATFDDVGAERRALIEGLQQSLGEFEEVVRDLKLVVSKGDAPKVEERIPLSLQYTVREALRDTRQSGSASRLKLNLPDRPVIARGHPETVQNAIRMLVLDAVSLAPEDVGVQITVEEGDEGMVIHVAVPDVVIPNDLLQRMLREPPDSADSTQNRLYAASNYVRASGGELTGSSSLSDGLHFRIVLPQE